MRRSSWPTVTQYNEAVQNLAASMGDEELRHGVAAAGPLGVPMPYSGGFADVYKVDCPATGNAWAVKFFKREVRGLRERYREISAHLERAKLPFMVDFRYLDEGVQIDGQWYPIVKLRWVEGLTLNEFVIQSLDQPRRLDQLVQLWTKLASRLRGAKIAHADLQHGNVMLVPRDEQGNLWLKLIDYDGMWVPALDGHGSGEVGHRHFQHPARLTTNAYNADVDRFSHLAICCALRCLSVGGRSLWQQFDNADNLLFQDRDFLQPSGSALFRELWTLRQPDAHALVGHLAIATQRPLAQTPWIDEVLVDGRVRPLSGAESDEVCALLGVTDRVRALPVARPLAADPSTSTQAPIASVPRAVAQSEAPQLPDATKPLPSIVIIADTNRPLVRRRTRLPGIIQGLDNWLARIGGGPAGHRLLRSLTAAALVLTLTITGLVVRLLVQGRPDSPVVADEELKPRADEGSSAAAVDAEIVAARDSKPSPTVTLPSGITLNLISHGEFLMGADKEKPEERPAHRVTISRDFYLGIHEVTRAQFDVVMGRAISNPQEGERPRSNVTWDEAQEFCRRLTSREASALPSGWVFRLPTEAEWEYACRAGSTGRFCFAGDEQQIDEYAWHKSNANGQTRPVGQKKPNAWGLHDMHGNVWEWCQDSYAASYYATSPAVDPSGPPSGFERVRRGGCWRAPPDACRSSYRFKFGQSHRYDDTGFRVAAGPNNSGNATAPEIAKTSSARSTAETPPSMPTGQPPPLAVAPFQQPQAKQHQQAWAAYLGQPVEKVLTLPGDVKLALILVPPGVFTRRSQEQQSYQVRITQPFYLGKYEVTQEQWQALMGSNPSKFKDDSQKPVEFVNWDAAGKFLLALKDHSSELTFSLPTEAQWELACRAGSQSVYSSGDLDRDLAEVGWFKHNSGGHTHRVGERNANPFGLYDMHGNVWEWCADGFDNAYYARAPLEDPPGAEDMIVRVMRGGCWFGYDQSCASGYRGHQGASIGSENTGFRVAARLASGSEPRSVASAVKSPTTGATPSASTTAKSGDASNTSVPPTQAQAEAKLPPETVTELRRLGGRFVVEGAKPSWSADSRELSFSRMPFGAGFGRHDLTAGTSTVVSAVGKDQAESPTKPGRYVHVQGNGAQETIWLIDPPQPTRFLAAGSFPAWARDGRTVLFHQPNTSKLMSLDVDQQGSSPVVVADVAGAHWYPSFSLDGKSAAFMLQGSITALQVSNAQRRTWPLPTGAPPRGFLSAWSADERLVSFASFGMGENYGLWVLDTQSSELRKILAGDAAQSAWSPDGKSLAVDLRPRNGVPQIWLLTAPKFNAPEASKK